MKKWSLLLLISLGLQYSNTQCTAHKNRKHNHQKTDNDIERQNPSNNAYSIIVNWVNHYQSYAQKHGIPEQTFFIYLAESCAVDENIIHTTIVAEQNCIQDFRDFCMTFAFAYEKNKNSLLQNFATHYQNNVKILKKMSNILQQLIDADLANQ